MDYLTAFILALSMSVDAMCASASDGIKDSQMSRVKSIGVPFYFGLCQFLMPVIGYFLGYIIKDYISDYISWIAFAVLLLLGLKSIYDGLKEIFSKNKESDEKKHLGLFEIIIQGIATSIDALTIGFINVDLSISNAMITFSIIGIVTFATSFITLILGKKIGSKIEKVAPFISGIIFIALAIKFLLQAMQII